MYQFDLIQTLRRRRRAPAGGGRRVRVSRTVVLLGLTSMFTDISSEMVAAILPLYLVFGVGLSPVQFGVIDGLYQGVTAPVRLLSGVLGDRWRRHKEIAVAGYGLSTLTRLALPLAGNAVGALTATVMADRIGKGIRTAPRDAMISLSSTTENLAVSFSVHRALDTFGAMLGPLVAFAILALAPLILGDPEDFTITRDGRRVRVADRNFWGVTFARDSDRFYATMRTGGRTWLIEGSVRRRAARALHPGVECPSLSPDGTRIAYKKRVDQGSVIWQLHVLDLRTMAETKLAESRVVDDQAEWLDDDTVLYGMTDAGVWAQPADGSGEPRLFLDDALSPAVVRPGGAT